jgi:hypothetical protein
VVIQDESFEIPVAGGSLFKWSEVEKFPVPGRGLRTPIFNGKHASHDWFYMLF